MQLEWNRWLEGITTFKQEQGLFLIFLSALLMFFGQKGKIKNNRLFPALILLGLGAFFPLTAMILMKIFTPFYDWMDLQQLLLLPLFMALFGVVGTFVITKREFPGECFFAVRPWVKRIASIVCVMLLFMVGSGFHVFDKETKADEQGVPVETAVVFGALYELIGEEPVVIAAPSKLLQYVRLYESDWIPLYGRDLWSGKAAGYVHSGYDTEYEYYVFLERGELNVDERPGFASLVAEGQADCVIVPYYWREDYCPEETYALLALTPEYNVIIKKELVAQ